MRFRNKFSKNVRISEKSPCVSGTTFRKIPPFLKKSVRFRNKFSKISPFLKKPTLRSPTDGPSRKMSGFLLNVRVFQEQMFENFRKLFKKSVCFRSTFSKKVFVSKFDIQEPDIAPQKAGSEPETPCTDAYEKTSISSEKTCYCIIKTWYCPKKSHISSQNPRFEPQNTVYYCPVPLY